MSAIAGKALNSTLGTSEFKGLNEYISDGFSKLTDALTPKIQTVLVELNPSKSSTTVNIEEVDVNRSKIEVSSSAYFITRGTSATTYIGAYYFSPTFISPTKIKIYYNLPSTNEFFLTLTITTYGG